MDREFTTRIERLFADCGVTDYYYDRGGKHPLLIARHGSAYIRYAIPSTGSDWRGVANCIAYIKRALDLRPRQDRPVHTSRRAHHAAKRPRAPLPIKATFAAVETKPARPTWQETLATHFGANC